MAAKKVVVTKNMMPIYASIIAVGFIAAIGAMVFGNSDKGQINVSEAISSLKQEQITDGTYDPTKANPTAKQDVPNGGLVGTGKADPKAAPAIVEEVATSTDESATSTDGVDEEGTDEENPDGDSEGSEGTVDDVEAEEVVSEEEIVEEQSGEQ